MPLPWHICLGPYTKGGDYWRQKGNKNKEEILALLEELWLPLKVAIACCPGHQNGPMETIRGKMMTDKVPKESFMASNAHILVALPPSTPLAVPFQRTKRLRLNEKVSTERWMVAYQWRSKHSLHGIHQTALFTKSQASPLGYQKLNEVLSRTLGWPGNLKLLDLPDCESFQSWSRNNRN